MIRHSDTVNPMAKPRESAAILRRVAVMAVRDARAAWMKARPSESPSEATLRKAYRSGVLAARSLRKAAAVSPRDRPAILEEADRVDAAVAELLSRLVRAAEGEIPATAEE